MKIRSLTIALDCENDAFGRTGRHEIARILRALADKIAASEDPGKLLDSNGNTVGHVFYNGDDGKIDRPQNLAILTCEDRPVGACAYAGSIDPHTLSKVYRYVDSKGYDVSFKAFEVSDGAEDLLAFCKRMVGQ